GSRREPPRPARRGDADDHAQPRRARALRRPRQRHVRGQDHRARHRARDLRQPAAPLYARAAALGAAPGRAAARAPRSHRGPAARSLAAARRLRVCAALRVPRRALPRGNAAAAADRRRRACLGVLGGRACARRARAGGRPHVSGEVLLEVRNLVKHFEIGGGLFGGRRGLVRAVDGVSFAIRRGETLGLVGESGCGKTTTGRCILQLETPTSGEILFEGRDLTKLGADELRAVRRRLQVIFQDPYSSLNPRMTVGEIIAEPLHVHGIVRGAGARRDRVRDLLRHVGLLPQHGARYPQQLSGCQRQRVGIARTLAMEPALIVCDEPVSALDVSIQAQIINLLEDLQAEFGLTYLFIAHDLAVVRHISDRVAVMYLGKIVELADRKTLYDDPLHPYTRALLSAVPIPDPELEARREHLVLRGEVPSPLDPPSGCVFHPRCPLAEDRCRRVVPELREVKPGHWAACLLVCASL